MTASVFGFNQSVIKFGHHKTKGNARMPDWLAWTIQEAAERTGYHPEHLRRLLRQGKIEGEMVGYMWLIKVDSIKAYIQKMQDADDPRYGPQKR